MILSSKFSIIILQSVEAEAALRILLSSLRSKSMMKLEFKEKMK